MTSFFCEIKCFQNKNPHSSAQQKIYIYSKHHTNECLLKRESIISLCAPELVVVEVALATKKPYQY